MRDFFSIFSFMIFKKMTPFNLPFICVFLNCLERYFEMEFHANSLIIWLISSSVLKESVSQCLFKINKFKKDL
jgi:hypothetical protein